MSCTIFRDLPEETALGIRTVDEVVFEKVLNRLCAGKFSVEEHGDLVGRGEREVQIVRNQDNGFALRRQRLHDARKIGGRCGIETLCRLIKEQQSRLRKQ